MPLASGAGPGNSINPPNFSFSDLVGSWGSAIVDPATYTTWLHIDGFSGFLMNETFLSAFSSSTYGSLDRDTMLGTIPNIFFILCLIVAALSVAVAVIEIRKLEMSRRVIH
ncbi:MAG: hypothetical protein LBH69_04050 [Methanomassiliicoccaceae archaeon]|jgi:hypothetical protein|nr:hypothetical protein [Methanomassiliicoccaceae archaeon]